MSTMTLIDEYLDALLDGGAPVDGDIPVDSVPIDGVPVDGVPLVEAGVHADLIAVSATHPHPDSMPEPEPAPPPMLAFVPAFVPAAPPSVAAPAITEPSATPPAAVHAPSPPAMAGSHRWLRVCVGHDSYALELLRVQEVVRLAPIVALRGAARAVLGVMNLRGRIVPVVDLGLWLDAGCVHGDERSRIVVVERDDEMIGVLVSMVEDVVTLGRERIEPPLASSDPGAIVGIARVGAAPTVLLDANALFG